MAAPISAFLATLISMVCNFCLSNPITHRNRWLGDGLGLVSFCAVSSVAPWSTWILLELVLVGDPLAHRGHCRYDSELSLELRRDAYVHVAA